MDDRDPPTCNTCRWYKRGEYSHFCYNPKAMDFSPIVGSFAIGCCKARAGLKCGPIGKLWSPKMPIIRDWWWENAPPAALIVALVVWIMWGLFGS